MKRLVITFLIAVAALLTSCGKVRKWDAKTKPVRLEFRHVSDSSDKGNLVLEDKVLIDNNDIDDARASVDAFGIHEVVIQMTPDGTDKFERITESSIGRQIAILLDDSIISTPTVRDPIREGRAVIGPMKSEKQARNVMAGILKHKEMKTKALPPGQSIQQISRPQKKVYSVTVPSAQTNPRNTSKQHPNSHGGLPDVTKAGQKNSAVDSFRHQMSLVVGDSGESPNGVVYRSWELAYKEASQTTDKKQRYKLIKDALSLLKKQALRNKPKSAKFCLEIARIYAQRLFNHDDKPYNDYYLERLSEEYDSLAKSPNKRTGLMEEWWMDPHDMKALEKAYDFDEQQWRDPRCHGLYWLEAGLRHAKGDETYSLIRLKKQILRDLAIPEKEEEKEMKPTDGRSNRKN